MFSNDNTGMYMPVAPAATNYGNNGFGFGGDGAQTEHERAEIQDVINYIHRKGM